MEPVIRSCLKLLPRMAVQGIIPPYVEPFNTCVYAQYTLQVDGREELQARLKEKGIPTAVHYPVPLHLQPAFASAGQGEGSFPVAEAIAGKVMSLPMHPYLEQGDAEKVAKAVTECLSRSEK